MGHYQGDEKVGVSYHQVKRVGWRGGGFTIGLSDRLERQARKETLSTKKKFSTAFSSHETFSQDIRPKLRKLK